MNIILPKASEKVGKRIDKIFMVMDLKDAGFGIFLDKKIKKIVGITTKISQNYYPEVLHKLIIVNAPFIFKAFFQAIKIFLDKNTIDKISIESGNGLKTI